MADGTTVSVLIKARDQASGAFRNVENNAGKMAQGIAKHRRAIGMGMLGMGAAITGVGLVMAKTAATFDAKMREVNSLVGLSQQEFQKLSQDTLDMSAAIGVDAVQASEALYQAISAGVPRENVIDFMTVASKAAIAGVTDTETAVDGLTTVINAFKMDISDAQKVADIMFVAVKGGKTTFDELAAAMQYVAPIAAALNVPFEAIGAAAATMTKQGIPTKMAFTALRQTFVSLMKPTAEMEDALKQVGFATGRALLDAKGLQGGLQLLTTGTNLTEAEMTKAFGSVEAFGAVLALTGQNATEAAADLEKSFNATGAATEAFNIINEGTARQFEIMQARMKVVSIEMGTVLLPIVIATVEKISDLASGIRDFYKDHPTLGKWLGLIGLGLGAVLIAFGGLLLILPGLVAGFTLLTGAAAPFVLAIVGIAAVVTAAIIVFKKWDEWSTKVKLVVVGLAIALGPLTSLILAAIVVYKNWDSIMRLVFTSLSAAARGAIGLGRGVLVAAKAVATFLRQDEFAASLQLDIDMLDRMQDSLVEWADTAKTNTKAVAMSSKDMAKARQEMAKVTGDALDNMDEADENYVKTVIARQTELSTSLAAIETKRHADAIGRLKDRYLAEDLANRTAWQDEVDKILEKDARIAKQRAEYDAREFAAQVATNEALANLGEERFKKEAAQRLETIKANDALRESNQKLSDDVGAFINQIQFEETELGKLGLTLTDVAKKYVQQGGDIDNLNTVMIALGGETASVADVMGALRLTVKDFGASAEGDLAPVLAKMQAIKLAASLAAGKGGQTSTWTRGAGQSERDARIALFTRWERTMRTRVGLLEDHANRQMNKIPPDVVGAEQLRRDAKGTDAEINRRRVIAYAAAQGGIVPLPRANVLVGERGPEVVSLPGASRVHPSGSGGGNQVNNFHFNGPVYGVDELREVVVEAVRDHALAGGFVGVFGQA